MSESGLSRRGLRVLFAAPVVLVGFATWAGFHAYGRLHPPTPVPPAAPADGPALYQQHCAYCHGPRGEGNGPAAITPRARYFGFDKFRFATTPNAVPCDDDLARLLRAGIPGSAMPKFDTLTDAEIAALIGHVRLLTRAGVYERWRRRAVKEEPDDPDLAGAAKKVEAEVQVLAPVPLPPLPPAVSLANGKKIFDTSCAQCHGPLGRGDGPQEQRTDDGTLIRPRDLTSGTYKGGGRTQDLHYRIFLGVPGTPMPATNTLPPQDMADLIAYVQSLASPTGKP